MISLITVTYNAEHTIQRCLDSVRNQTFKNIEYIVIDGNSSDSTPFIIASNQQHINIFKSEPDQGIYDAMNKGLQLATGDIIGMLNADDYFADSDVLFKISEIFSRQQADIVYSDLDYVDHQGKIIRKWRSGAYHDRNFNWGWMPPHPTFYVKREYFSKYGLYDLGYGTAADYELMLRFMYKKPVRISYLKAVTVKMVSGGVSNSSFGSRAKAWGGDFSAMKANALYFPLMSLILKPIRKIMQFYT